MTPSGYPDASATGRGLMSAADKSKLDGIPPGGGSGAVTSVTQANGLTLTAGDLAMGAAGAAAAGAVTTGAQEFSGVKTLTGAILNGVSTIAEAVTSLVRAVGASLVLRSSLGAGASDKCVIIGSSVADGSVNATAKLASLATGLGGTEVEKGYWKKNGNFVVPGTVEFGTHVYNAVLGGFFSGGAGIGMYNTNGAAYLALDLGTGRAQCSGTFRAGSTVQWTGNTSGGLENVGTSQSWLVAPTGRSMALASPLGAGASDVATKAGSSTADASVASTAKLWGAYTGLGGTEVEKAFIAKDGTVELTGAGVGIVLRSPDGTRWRLTVANGGTLSITAA